MASVDGKTVVVGNAALLTSLGLSLTRFGDWPERLQQQGQHVLFVAVDGKAAGFLGVFDSTWSADGRPDLVEGRIATCDDFVEVQPKAEHPTAQTDM